MERTAAEIPAGLGKNFVKQLRERRVELEGLLDPEGGGVCTKEG